MTTRAERIEAAARKLMERIDAEGGHGFPIHGLNDELRAALALDAPEPEKKGWDLSGIPGPSAAETWRDQQEARETDLSPEAARIMRENLWNLYGPLASPAPEPEKGGEPLPETGALLKCLVCAHEKPWGTYHEPTGVAVCVECRDAPAQLTEARAILEAIETTLRGGPVSDFMESFPIVRLAQDRMLDAVEAIAPTSAPAPSGAPDHPFVPSGKRHGGICMRCGLPASAHPPADGLERDEAQRSNQAHKVWHQAAQTTIGQLQARVEALERELREARERNAALIQPSMIRERAAHQEAGETVRVLLCRLSDHIRGRKGCSVRVWNHPSGDVAWKVTAQRGKDVRDFYDEVVVARAALQRADKVTG